MKISDSIESFIMELLGSRSSVELKRNELAAYFNCVPSQINYVIQTRFTKELTTEKAFIAKVDVKLAGKFAQNAPKEVVEAEKEKRANAARRVEKLESYLQNL